MIVSSPTMPIKLGLCSHFIAPPLFAIGRSKEGVRGQIKRGRKTLLHRFSYLAFAVRVRGFELPAPCLWLFVVAFCELQLRARCLYLCAIFYLHLLVLLHRSYMERLWNMEVIVVGFSQNCIISWMWSVLRLCRK